MPTSNGQISSRDIRQKAIKTNHVVDSAITTAKVADVAVTVEKTDEPVWTMTAEAVVKTDSITLNTTAQEVNSVTVDIPSWVGSVSGLAVGTLQISNSSGGAQGLQGQIAVNGNGLNFSTVTVPNSSVGNLVVPNVIALSTPGASLEISVIGAVTTGTNAANQFRLSVVLVGVR